MWKHAARSGGVGNGTGRTRSLDPNSGNEAAVTNQTEGNNETMPGQLDGGDSLGDNSGTGQASTHWDSEDSGNNGRTHRDWFANPGRSKKCDFCEERSVGMMHQCTRCPVLICRTCAFNGEWERDMRHYINPGNFSWDYPGSQRTYVPGPGSQHAPPSSYAGSGLPSDEATKTDNLGQKRKVHFASDDAAITKVSIPHDQSGVSGDLSSASPPTDENLANSIPSSFNQPGQPHQHREASSRVPVFTAAAGRSEVRASAAMAMHRMSTPARRYRDNMNNIAEVNNANANAVGGNNHGGSYVTSMGSRWPGRPQMAPLPRGSSRPTVRAAPSYPMPRQGPYTGPFPSRKREQQVMSTYYDIFETAEYRPSSLNLTEIPRTVGPFVMASLGHHNPPLPYQPTSPDFLQPLNQAIPQPAHEVYHRQVQEYMMSGGYFDPDRHLPPQPPNYAEDSFHNYPNGQGYIPTLRNTPIWTPLNDLSPEELRIMHNDRLILERVSNAWNTNRIILRVRAFGLRAWNLNNWVGKGGSGPGDFEALKLLWDVAQVRMHRIVLPSAFQTRKWFVDEVQNVFFSQPGGETGNISLGEFGVPENGTFNPGADADADADGDVDMDDHVEEYDEEEEEDDDDVEYDSPSSDDNHDSDYDPSTGDE